MRIVSSVSKEPEKYLYFYVKYGHTATFEVPEKYEYYMTIEEMNGRTYIYKLIE